MKKPHELSKLALVKIKEFNHSPTPEIYTVWYEYFSEYLVQLKRELELALQNNTLISEEFILELFNKYFGGELGEQLKVVVDELKLLISKLVEELSKSSSIYSDNSKKIFKIKKEIKDGNLTNIEITEIVDKLIEHIDSLEKREKVFQITLENSNEKFLSLKNKIEKLERDAKIDELTGLLNRRGFKEALDKVLNDEEVNKIGIIFADIDNFKSINDTYGHLIGDEVLKFIAKIFKQNLKGKDIICRWGGEEFIIIIVNSSFENVSKIAENLRAAVAKKRLILKKTGEKMPQITLSFGATMLSPNETMEDAIERADELTYYSKTHGKNRVTARKNV